MSMPKIVGSNTKRSQAITDIIESVSLEQAALSHVLNAEGKKIQKIIAIEDISREEILQVNESVKDTVESVAQLESMLMSKLKLFGDALKPPMPIRFSFNKKDINSHVGLSGAEFELINSDGIVVETAKSVRGIVTFKKAYVGTYTMREVTAPLGYHFTPEIFTVIIGEDKDVTINGTSARKYDVYNIPYPSLTVNKTDESNAALAGAEFSLTSSGNSYTAKSKTDGKAVFERILPGIYQLIETKAPSGYQKSTDTHTVTVSDDGVMMIDSVVNDTVTMKNTAVVVLRAHVIFNDNHNEFDNRPSTVTVNLYKNEIKINNFTVNTADDFYVPMGEHEKYKSTGVLNEYRVDEDTVTNYDTVVTGFEIVNTPIKVQ